MPLIVEAAGGQLMWARKPHAIATGPQGRGGDTIRIALVNNMPDAALEETELQFFDLLDAASEDFPVLLKLYSLTGVPRSDRGMRHLNSFYFSIDDLWRSQFDAVIMTGTEPRQPDLRYEPYWSTLVNVLEWAERNTVSTILSCLAAHAGVLYSDGIARVRLPDKMFGVFNFAKVGAHALTSRSADGLRFPHSRWNGLDPDALTGCGYQVLTQNTEAGVDCFVKRKGRSLVVHFQGHPEYQAHTLFKEYRRDIKRFLRGERETYPTVPSGYFDGKAAESLKDFQQKAKSKRSEDAMADFPEAIVTSRLQNEWHDSAVMVYRNWLEFVYEKKPETSCYSSVRVRRFGNTLRYME
jgi:homoserine O-succinyltransferase/O-acetyltransferase